MYENVPVWMWIAGFLLVLGPLVTVHELGHYLVGRWFGVKADVFSVGFGREVAGYTDKRGTRWRLSTIPLGGYVQFAGDMNPASQPDENWLKLPVWEREQAFQSKKLWQRALIVAAGPVTNVLVALAIFFAFFVVFGRPVAVNEADSTLVRAFVEGSAAEQAGVEIGDRVKAIDGEAIESFNGISERVAMFPGKRILITVERGNGRLDIPVTVASSVEKDRFGNESRIGRLGIYSMPLTFEPVGPGSALLLSGKYSLEIVRTMVIGLRQIVTGDRSVKELGGFVKIAKFSGEQLSLGPLAFVHFAALISLNLAFINFLPIPALDGGHLAFYAAEAIRRKPVSQRSMDLAFRTGFAFVLALMLIVTINDVASLPFFGG